MTQPLLPILLVAVAACAASPAETTADAGACGSVEADLLHPRCATSGCHTAGAPAGGLDLASPNVLARLTNKPAVGGGGMLIVHDDPATSVIVKKLASPPPFGSRMPVGAALDASQIACVKAWIASAP
jgi:hypothetical protein